MSRKVGKRYRYRTNTQDLDWHEERADAAQNIGDTQRLVSAIAGVGLVIEGWRRRSMAGGALAVGGMALLYRAATGYCAALGAMGIDMRAADRIPDGWVGARCTRTRPRRSEELSRSTGRRTSSIASGVHSTTFRGS